MKLPEIPIDKFYKIGIYTFLIIGACNLISFFITFGYGNLFSYTGQLAGIFFNFVMAGFFKYLSNNQPKSQLGSSVNVDEMLKEFEKEMDNEES